MTREDRLWTMKDCDLIAVADRLNIMLCCNKNHTKLKEDRKKVIEKILKAEAEKA